MEYGEPRELYYPFINPFTCNVCKKRPPQTSIFTRQYFFIIIKGTCGPRNAKCCMRRFYREKRFIHGLKRVHLIHIL